MIAALLLAAATSACSVVRPAACRDTNVLAWSADFQPMLRRFFRGARPEPLLYRGSTLAQQAADVLGGPPDKPTRIGTHYRFTACRAHSCFEKGALVLAPAGRPIAIAILHSPCALPKSPANGADVNLLSIYVRPGADRAVIVNLERWARASLPASPIPETLADVRIICLG